MAITALSKNQYLVESESGETYKVQLTGPDHSIITCTCKGFQFRRSCKHIEEIKDMLKESGRKIKVAKQPLVDFPYIKAYIDDIYKTAKSVLKK